MIRLGNVAKQRGLAYQAPRGAVTTHRGGSGVVKGWLGWRRMDGAISEIAGLVAH